MTMNHNPEQHMHHVFESQRLAFTQAGAPDASERKTHIRAIKRQLQRYQNVLADAMNTDFGIRSHAESKMFDVLSGVLDANHALSHLSQWMKPSKRSTELLFKTNSLQVTYQPKGVVGVIVPWNFPIYLAVGPLITALAAGNRVMIKMSEATPVTNALFRRMLAEIFTEDRVAVFGEELINPAAFSELPFNHIVFTGSPAVGKIIMRAAADHLTPVTLELGGKSPAVVLRDYSISDAAMRVAHGKSANGGQICVSPDYVLVPRESMATFVNHAQAAFESFYGKQAIGNPDFTAMIHERHHQRVMALLDDAKAKGAKVLPCADVGKGDGRQMPLHLVWNCTDDMALMQEEIFGPILPIVAYDSLDEAIAYINARPRPLALYCFTHENQARERLLRFTHSGGVTVNDWAWHVLNHDAPFGGVGNSGMGTYHGVEGFRELSHARTVFIRHRFFPTQLFHPPFGNLAQRLSMSWFLGKADPTLKS